mgnify:CR=1 FL=1
MSLLLWDAALIKMSVISAGLQDEELISRWVGRVYPGSRSVVDGLGWDESFDEVLHAVL